MKKDEIVVLSNDIEIINGVEVDWSKYKGKDNNRARNSYIGLCELLHKNGHTLECDYINAITKVYINFSCKHPIHKITPSDYKRGVGCPHCAKIKRVEFQKEKSKKAQTELYELAEENGHIILGEYKGALTPIVIDFKCGHSAHKITPSDYKRGVGCPHCAKMKTTEFKKEKSKQELYELAEENGHIILGEYINNSTPIVIDFKCGHSAHKITPNHYKQGRGCPICKASKGEKEIARVLKEMNIKYQEQYKFEDCRHINSLPFDFYISELNLCIEYDGKHHYESVVYYKKEDSEHKKTLAQKVAEERLKETQRRDKIKTYYCRDNGINLIRIPYWEFDNIEKIIKKELSKYTQVVA